MMQLMLLLAAGALLAGTHFSIGIGFGVPGYWAPAPTEWSPTRRLFPSLATRG
jgi:hypothetical protein